MRGDWNSPAGRAHNSVEGTMKPEQAISDLRYEGEARGSRQTYHIFRGRRHFLVLSFRRDDPSGGNFNIIDSAAVSYAEEKLHGSKGVTARQLLEESRRTKHFKDRFAALNTLYVLVALKKARVLHGGHPGALVFNFR
jgi:hypothetical protein